MGHDAPVSEIDLTRSRPADAIDVHLALVPHMDDGRIQVEGIVAPAGAPGIAFSGWIGLLGLLESLIERSATGASTPDGTTPSSPVGSRTRR